jgi:phosphoribosylaminoimidazole-succinocarboxamide synthase
MKKSKIYEGKAKILYKGPEQGTLIQHFKDDATANNNEKMEIFEGKGVINNRISEHIFTLLSAIDIPNHFIKRLNMREQLIHEVDIIPLEVVIRNVATGSLTKRLGIPDGEKLTRPLIEFYLKDDLLKDPIVSEEHIITFGWANQNELDDISSLAFRINDFLVGYFSALKIQLIDFKIEFGRIFKNEEVHVILADEISPDSCRLWDFGTKLKMDKDVFRESTGNLLDGYHEVARRMGLININEVSKNNKPTLIKG